MLFCSARLKKLPGRKLDRGKMPSMTLIRHFLKLTLLHGRGQNQAWKRRDVNERFLSSDWCRVI
jgi:hypothetical protein